jgi:hypothetical protein
MESTVQLFEQHILDSSYVMDPYKVHHELVGGMHGPKLDFDNIPEESDLFGEWVDVTAERIYDLYAAERLGRIVLLSVANGTNRLVEPVANLLGHNVMSAWTEKDGPTSVKLTDSSEYLILVERPDLVLVIEDVVKSGSTLATAVTAARTTGVNRVEALSTYQRRAEPAELNAIDVVHNTIIKKELPDYTPEQCRGDMANGYCAREWTYIPRLVDYE